MILSLYSNFICVVFIVGHNAFLNKLGVIPHIGEKAGSNITTRIVGGTSATQGQFPYQVI